VAEYAKRAGLEPTQTLDLGGGVKLELVLIPAGTFVMGSPETEKNRDANETAHEVTLTKPCYLGRFEVTQEQYRQISGASPSQFEGRGLPVDSVSWDDAQAFCKKATRTAGFQPAPEADKMPAVQWAVRLPTEAEWEYACRAGVATSYHSGATEADLDRAGWYNQNSGETTHPVGQKAANAWGLYDTHGNVWEWCADWFALYPAGAATDPRGAAQGQERVLRGGSWFCDPGLCRSSNRRKNRPVSRFPNYGFRVAADAPKKP
jgi:formylglycine-generating enzyme required for sulfatase activity